MVSQLFPLWPRGAPRAQEGRAEVPGPRPGARQGALAAAKRRERINQFIRSLGFLAARALFCRVGSILPQRPVPRQAAAVSLIFHWFFHTNLRWCKVCSGGARRCWRGGLGHLAAAAVSSLSKNHRFRDILTWSASYVYSLGSKHVFSKTSLNSV